ncbi:marine proteobacterial sortase target protein, partial [Methylopila musalis]
MTASLPPLRLHDPAAPSLGARTRGVFAALVMLAALGLAGVAALVASTLVAGAAEPGRLAFVTPGRMTSGALLLRGTEPGAFVEAPQVRADYDVTVSGPTLRTRVTQAFRNPTDGWVEGVYVYPLPEKGAVDAMRLVIGERVIVADVKKREEAKQIYETAKREGKTAALVEQERPNLFTNSVANIGPGETVVVQIEYQAPVHQEAERMSLRLPLVVAPRYLPPAPLKTEVSMETGSGWGQVDPVPDRERVSPPVNDPRETPPSNPVAITVRLNAGFALGEVASATHRVTVEGADANARTVTLADGDVPADRDFELTWTAQKGPTPSVGLFRETVGGSDYVIAYVTPPALAAEAEKRPREAIFVIDNSGSMSGPSMAQAKASLLFALDRLTPRDRFDVIRFDTTMERLFPDTVDATPENVARARAFVARISASGGTEMLAPLQAALADPRPDDVERVRQIVFLTDGAIGDEQRMFDAIGAGRGRSRLFMVGIGSAPNGFLMTRAAELGRGAFTQIGSAEEVDTRMRELFAKLESPAVTGLSATFGAGGADVTPRTLPDIYRGEPLVVAARLAATTDRLEMGGMFGDR